MLVSLAGCGLFRSDEDKELERLLKAKAEITVFVTIDVTPQQKDDIEARLRTVPGVTGVVFEDHEAAYARMKKVFADDPTKMPDIPPSYLPQSFVVTMKDQAAVRKVRDSGIAGELKALPGVQDLVIICTTVDECKKKKKTSPSPAVS
ncbi:permease-like cell division protein FtsX [Actinoplanes sp. CA-142083]|uniref:permease-like cell division protein FtsX n=1 Tax=Actinoplanes sp. CA-142083 TaxID=3239903 RepID=UPI003D8C889B